MLSFHLYLYFNLSHYDSEFQPIFHQFSELVVFETFGFPQMIIDHLPLENGRKHCSKM